MSFNSTYKIPLPSSRLTEIRQNKMLYANYISKIQANNQGCDTARTGMVDGNIAPGSIIPDLVDGARNTTAEERDAVLDSTACPVAVVPAPEPEPIVKILTHSLILYYDAGIASSYSGSGTSIFDLSPNGYTGTLINNLTYSSLNGGSLVFDGNNTYIDTNQSLGAEDFTLNAWIKTSKGDGYQAIISKETSDGSAWNYRIYMWTADGQIAGDIKITGATALIRTGPNVADGQWHMVTFSRSSTTNLVKMYVDGINTGTITRAFGSSIINSQEVWIGYSAFSGGSYGFLGNIASVFIYNRTQSDDDVLYNYNATKTRFGL